MYKPKYQYTQKFIQAIAEVGKNLGFIESATLLKKDLIELQFASLARSVHSSTSIEGNRLTLEQVTAVLKGRELQAPRKDIIEVKNYKAVLDYIHREFNNNDKLIAEVDIKHLNRITLKNLDPRAGRYRKEPVGIIDTRTGFFEYIAAPQDDVPRLMRNFVAWLNSNEAKSEAPEIKAGIAHFQFVTIHPFMDGNGRTGRALATLILSQSGRNINRLFALEDYYNRDRAAYYKALHDVQGKEYREDIDITSWLEYFVEGIASESNQIVNSIKQKIAYRKLRLTEGQKKILEFLRENETMSNKEYVEFTGLSRRTGVKDFNRLIKLNKIRRVGKGRNIHYILAE